jgi:aryl-alcohol dehydrogenase-like predicted oxidoreductase
MSVPALNHFRLLGRSGLKVSPLCLGCMTFGEKFLGMTIGANKDEARKVFDRYVELGGNFFDTANTYTDGDSERFLGEFIKDRRDQFVIATKYSNNIRKGDPNAGGNSRKSLFQSVENSLRNLQTSYIDLLYVHYWDFTTPPEEVMRSLDDVVRSGKVHYVAISDTPAWRIAQMNDLACFRGWSPFIGLQTSYSLVERTSEHELFPMADEYGLGILPWSPLASGLLTGKYLNKDPSQIDASSGRQFLVGQRSDEWKNNVVKEVVQIAKEVNKSPAQVALNWVIQQPFVTSTIIGARTLAQLEDNISALSFTLSKEHLNRLTTISQPAPIFPHNFLHTPMMKVLPSGGTQVQTRRNYLEENL